MLSSRGSSQPRDQTHASCISCIGRWVFITSATWEAQRRPLGNYNCSKKKKKEKEKKKNRLALWTGVKGKPDKDKLTDDTEEESVRKVSGLGNT